MESALIDLRTTTLERWQWESSPHLLSRSEEQKWEFYFPKHNYLIEKAYDGLQKEVDLEDFPIDLLDMIQVNKGDLTDQHLIRRINLVNDKEISNKNQQCPGMDRPRTMNKILGGLEDLMSFFSTRNPEIWAFKMDFENIEKSNNLKGLHEKIISKVIACLEEELLKPQEEQTKHVSHKESKINAPKKLKKKHQDLIALFTKPFSSFEEFYGTMLRSYTMPTCLYRNLNKYLRDENWIEIDKLLPYAFCLCKSFYFKLNNRDQDQTKPESNFLFRGTAFDESTLRAYNPKEIKRFSWNSVTSTSSIRQKAENFMYYESDEKAKRFLVIFKIEVPITNHSMESHSECIDVRQYAAIPEESEVVLPPGSVFELQEVERDEGKTTIKIKLLGNMTESLAQEGLIMQWKLLRQMITDKCIKIICLRGDDLSDTLKCLTGNRLIEIVEFCLCKFDDKSLEIMMEMLPTLERAKELKFISCFYQRDGKILIPISKRLASLQDLKIEISEIGDFHKIFWARFLQERAYWVSSTSLEMNFRSIEKVTDKDMISFSWQALKNLVQLTSLNLSFNNCQLITDFGISALASCGLQNLKGLISLSLDFRNCDKLTDKGIYYLSAQGLQCLNQLTSLCLDFSNCHQITDVGLSNIALKGLQPLVNLTRLDLNFHNCYQITDEGINSLASRGLRYLTELAWLTLNFSECGRITSQGVNNLSSQGFQKLRHLVSLRLSFERCNQISDKGLNYLASGGISYLANSRPSKSHFRDWSPQILDQGINPLCCQELPRLTHLKSIALNFSGCEQITNQGIKLLFLQGLQYLTELASLSLDFGICRKLTDEGIDILCSEGLRNLTQLKSLTLHFPQCTEITDGALRNLCFKGLQPLNQLVALSLNFSECHEISDKGLEELASEGLHYLTNLTSLSLNFAELNQITNEGVGILSSRGIGSLAKLTSLSINLLKCKQIKDEVINQFFFQELKNRTQLTSFLLNEKDYSQDSMSLLSDVPERKLVFARSLKNALPVTSEPAPVNQSPPEIFYEKEDVNFFSSLQRSSSLNLNFSKFKEIDDEGIYHLCCRGLQTLTHLSSFRLHFEDCRQITDLVVNILASTGLSYLTQLTSLNLNFCFCKGITDLGILSLCDQGLEKITGLTSLTLNFVGCKELTDEGMSILCKQGLGKLPKLNSLNLNFAGCEGITDKGICLLASQGLKKLQELRSLRLNLSWGPKITNEGVDSLASQGLKNLIKLDSLDLKLENCQEITDQGVQNLSLQGLSNLSQLTSFSLSFLCMKITDEGMTYLASQGLKKLNKLESLNLKFERCQGITNKGVSTLASEGQKYGTQLKSLKLDFAYCVKITDEGVSDLYYEGIRHFVHLSSLNLNFQNCDQISSFTISNILKAFHYFGYRLE